MTAYRYTPGKNWVCQHGHPAYLMVEGESHCNVCKRPRPMVKRYRFVNKADGRMRLLYHERTGLGLTLWRRGAATLQFRGHMMSVVLGDWWEAHPTAPASCGGFTPPERTLHLFIDGEPVQRQRVSPRALHHMRAAEEVRP